MFAPKLLGQRTREAASSRGDLVHRQAPSRRSGDQALLASNWASVIERDESEAGLGATGASRVSRDFGNIHVFPPQQSGQSQTQSPIAASSRVAAIQPKLEVGGVNDPLEHQADRVADQVMGMPATSLYKTSPPTQRSRKCETCEEEDRRQLQTKPARAPETIGQEARQGAGRTDRIGHRIAGRLFVGSASDPLEADAERSARQPNSAAIRVAASPPLSGFVAPPIVASALASPARPLDTSTRTHFEQRYHYDFSTVSVHAGVAATESTRAIAARAYTVGNHVVLGASSPERVLLAHELAHVVQQSSAATPWVQRQQASPTPRKDFVFIMGSDQQGTSNPFYTNATRYFRAHLPAATFVEDQRNLADLLNWVSTNVKEPIGNLYIVSHGNEDGTMQFGLNPGTTSIDVVDLRNALHPKGGGTSTLTSVATVIDWQTKIHIKGCDIGRTQEMVLLIDEAFGGAGTVTAPTHEQGYKVDTTLGTQARQEAHDTRMAAFTAGLPALPAEPGPIDPKLTGAARQKAKQEHDAAVQARKVAQAARQKAIRDEETRITPELAALAEKAATVDLLSGPMFQRPGTNLFTATEVQPEVDRLYGHLSADQRKALVQRLVARDSGTAGDQKGQRVQRITPSKETMGEPASLAEAKNLYRQQFKDNHFTPTTMTQHQSATGGEVTLEITIQGTTHPPGVDPSDYTLILTESRKDDAAITAEGKANTNNPDRYQWRIERTHENSGNSTFTAVGERVIAYLHHGSLDVGPHEHFGRSEDYGDFYTTVKPLPPGLRAPSTMPPLSYPTPPPLIP
ncbi:MAG: DUF4157 domain-containing protein [Acidobacteriaceae bacterium]|nr:DUF4157 domain-containing protein [Acidobacteriaceae bacterium]MBV9296239.1 DUF4157 domain-containing protein [Acidobacteriaceae bacterium]